MDITNLIGLLVATGCLIFGLYRLWKALKLYRRRAASKTWLVTTGTVISKDISFSLGSEAGKTYTPQIKYKYTVRGNQFEKTISLDEKWWKSSAEDALDQTGDTIEVLYNPDEPEEHITTWEKVTAGDAITILLILIVSLAFLYSWIR